MKSAIFFKLILQIEREISFSFYCFYLFYTKFNIILRLNLLFFLRQKKKQTHENSINKIIILVIYQYREIKGFILLFFSLEICIYLKKN